MIHQQRKINLIIKAGGTQNLFPNLIEQKKTYIPDRNNIYFIQQIDGWTQITMVIVRMELTAGGLM